MGNKTQKIEIAVRMAVDVKEFTVDGAQYTYDDLSKCFRVWNNTMTIVVPVSSLLYIHILT